MEKVSIESVQCRKCGLPRIGNRDDGRCSHCGNTERAAKVEYAQSPFTWLGFVAVSALVGAVILLFILIREVSK